MHFGVIKVVSHDRLAQQALWDRSRSIDHLVFDGEHVSGLIGMLILRVKQPVATMVDQAEAITERHFLTISRTSHTGTAQYCARYQRYGKASA